MTRTRSERLGVPLCVLALLLSSGIAAAQSTATLQGTVTDAQNAVMPGVTVTIQNAGTALERTTVTDAAGQYVAASLQPGHYQITAHLDGFTDAKSETDLGPAQTIALNLKLNVGTLAENVTVTGAAPLIDTATTSVGQVMQERTVQEIPLNGRHFVDLGPLMPGGVTAPSTAGLAGQPLRGQGAFSFISAGNRETAVNFMINGINLNDLSNSQVTFQPSINTVSEFKVDNSTFSAEYGRNSGSIVNVATRSGTNAIHGEAFDFYRDAKFDSRNYFNPAPAPQSSFNRKQFGFNVGGPIVKNKTFFFGSYEGLRHLQTVDLNSGTLTSAQRAGVVDPTAKNLLQYIPQANDSTGTRWIGGSVAPVDLDQYTIDARHNLKQSDDLHFYYAYQRDIRQEPNAQGNTVAGFGDTRGGHRQVMTVNETHIFNQALVNEVRFGYNRLNISFNPNTLVDTNALGINVGQTQMPIALPEIRITGPGLDIGGPSAFPSGREVTTFAAGDTATYLKGNHIIKFGGEYRRVKHYSFNGDPGLVTYPSIASFQQGWASSFQITLGDRSYNAYNTAIGGFLQDAITLSPNIKLDVGLRYDYIGSPTEADNKLVTFDPATASLLQINGQGGFTQVHKNGSDFEPRLGLVWTPGDGKLAIRSAYAVMVNQTNNGYFTGMTANPPLVNPQSAAAAGSATSNINISNAIGGAGGTALSPSFTDPNWEPGRMQSWNVNVEREIGSMGLMVGYFGSHGDRLPVVINANQFTTPGGTVRIYPRVSATSPIDPNVVLSNITERISQGWSNYNGLWVTVNHRYTHGLQVSGSYTLSKSKDTNSGDANGATNTNGQVQDSFNLADNYALSDFDVRHRVSFNASYDLPFKGNRLKDGWQIVVVEQAQTGGPMTITTNIATITGITSVRPDLIGPLPTALNTPNLDANTGAVTSVQWFPSNIVCDPRIAGSCTSSSVFALPYSANGVAHFGNLPRNAMIGPGFGNTDLSFIKNIGLTGSAKAQLRIEIFNLFNQANLNLPGRVAAIGSTSFGVISSTRFPTGDSGSARQIQFAAKFLF